MSKAKTRTIDIRTDTGIRSVSAICRDGLAVHEGAGGWPDCWTITHLPSGLSVMKGIESKAKALRAVTALLKEWDWSVPVNKRDIPKDLGFRVCAIAEKYGGEMHTGEGVRRVDKLRLCPKGFNAEVLSP